MLVEQQKLGSRYLQHIDEVVQHTYLYYMVSLMNPVIP